MLANAMLIACAATNDSSSMTAAESGKRSVEASDANPIANANTHWPSFQQIDTDGNGYIDQQEAASVPVLDFGMADVDRDRRLGPSEYEGAKRNAPARGGESDTPIGGTAPGTSGK